MRRALFFAFLGLAGCSEREAADFAGERVDEARWVQTAGPPATAREHAAALALGDGRVLISGGFDNTGAPLAASEIYNPVTDTWRVAPALSVARGRAAVIDDSIIGGLGVAPRPEGDRYIGDAGYAPLPFLTQARYDAAAVRLATGGVLVTGGTGGASIPLATTEFSPSGGAWNPAGPLLTARARHTATALPTGRVLIAGGSGVNGPLASTEIRGLDGGFEAGPPMAQARVRHTATLLPSGDVLLVGGDGDAGRTAELFVASSSTLRALPGPVQPRSGHSATLLPDGTVLVAGGRGATAGELFNPDAGVFSVAGCLVRPRESHVAALSGNGVLLAFGRTDGGLLTHSERFVPDGGAARGGACTADCQCASGHCAGGVCCDRACDKGCETCATTGLCRTVLNQTVCRAAVSGCDLEDRCDGVSADCPPDRVSDAGVVCRSPVGTCDDPEVCSGASPLCPADVKKAAGFVCRAAVASCDLAESCDGDAGTCPADALAGATTVCRPSVGTCDAPEQCSGTSAFCPTDLNFSPGTVCRAAAGVCDEVEACTGGPQCPADRFFLQSSGCGEFACPGDGPACRSSCEVDGDCAATAICDAGVCVHHVPEKKRYVGFGFGCAQADAAPLLFGALALLLLRRRRGAVRAAVVALCFLAPIARAATPEPSFGHTGTEGHQGFALRLDLLLLKDLLATPFGGEAGLNLALSERFDLGAWVSIGRYPGARLGVTLHTRDDGERFRPFLQLRGLVHPVPGGVAAGAGLFGGVTAEAGPGRLVLGLLFEGYAGPPEYVPMGLYVLLGYQFDLYRAPDPRRSHAVAYVPEPEPAPAPAAAPVPALRPEPASEPGATPAPTPTPGPEPELTRVVTRIQIREQLFFGERQVKLDAGLKARAKKVADALKLLPLKKLEVAGHADDLPTEEKCVALSLRRAEAVVEALVAAGVPSELLVAKGYGRSMAVVSTVGPPKKREKNRRVEFNVLEMASP